MTVIQESEIGLMMPSGFKRSMETSCICSTIIISNNKMSCFSFNNLKWSVICWLER